jgi:MFS transporter, ACS family, tartrate transporter
MANRIRGSKRSLITTSRELAGAEGQASLAARTIAKVGWRLLPFLLLLYIVSWLDRVNIGIAALQMNKELSFDSEVFGFGAGIFFVSYALFELPSNLILARVGARLWIARIMITWGLVSVAMLLVNGPTSFYVLRFLLGVAEAGFLPGIIYYLGNWYPSAARARAVSWFMLGIPLSAVIGSPLGGLILGLDGWHGFAGWQWLFLLEGLPAVLLGFVVLFYLTDSPAEARWLEPEEREWLAAAIRTEQSVADRHAIGLGRALLHPTVWLLCLILFACQAGSYGMQFWVPQIVQGMAGFTNFEIGLISAIPYAAAAIGMIAIGTSSDHSGERLLHLAIPTAVAAVGFVVSAFYTTPVLGVLALTVAIVGVTSTRGPFWALPTRFLTGRAAAGGIALINLFAAISGFVGPYVIGYLVKVTGSYAAGMFFLALLMALGALLCVPLSRAKVLADDTAAQPPGARARS